PRNGASSRYLRACLSSRPRPASTAREAATRPTRTLDCHGTTTRRPTAVSPSPVCSGARQESGPRGRGNSTSIASGTPVECSRGDAGPVASGAVSMAAMGRTDERAYGRAGVDLDAAARTMDLITREVASTYTPGVLRGLGAFGGLFELPAG